MPKRDWPRILIRIPPDTKNFLIGQAERNASSLNSEIVRCIRQRMDELSRTEDNTSLCTGTGERISTT
ncbi:hypothetical protein GCM10007094_13170 [Pseudovibrio japonicus]|uniref:Arc-like DNA binding domain-containing protein n=1 Tax=Pseudovibrio japonicus TaxID=366534 RepID=A0ABQ3E4X2_9HYPH|nr:hypothetical protein GCM10007094_13170 [Pseudovibrio japonicus]